MRLKHPLRHIRAMDEHSELRFAPRTATDDRKEGDPSASDIPIILKRTDFSSLRVYQGVVANG